MFAFASMAGPPVRLALASALAACMLISTATADPAAATRRLRSFSTAYGSLNNFDCVNDTGVEAHGFEIELEDMRSVDITYTYDYNHYGVPKITEDLSIPSHPKVLIRHAAVKRPDGSWSAYTAIPSGPINPTDGHQFTDPSVNFGGEHFGVGYYGNPTAVRYNWLIDDGAGNLIKGPPVYVATPTFVYYPPAPAVPAQVVAAIMPPPPPALPDLQFGEPSWVKAIKTTTHNPAKVRLQDLVADDPGQPQPWANGEPAEVETEWSLLQTEFGQPDGGANGELQGAPEDLPDGDEIITRRYEFYKYIGPIDAETGEAMASEVAPDGLHGVGTVTYADYFDFVLGEWHTTTVDLSTIVVVGEFFGAQMSGFDVAPMMGLIDHIQDGVVGEPYADRMVVIPGGKPWMASIKSGSLPDGLTFDPLTGILSGTPTAEGIFTVEIEAVELDGPVLTKTYVVAIASGAAPDTFVITTAASPLVGGTTSGGGVYSSGDSVTVEAVPNPGYFFVDWTHGGVHFAWTPSHTFPANANLDLVANFVLDTTAPVTTASLSGALGTNDWYRGDVTVTLTATDGQSGVASTTYSLDGGAPIAYTAPFTVTGEGPHSVDFFSTDVSGNTEATQAASFKIDSVAPNVTIVSPAQGAIYLINQSVLATYSAEDATSGIASLVGTVPGGSAINTASVGTKTFEATATDNAGNASTQTATYKVGYGVHVLKVAAGKALDVTMQLVDANGVNMSSASITVTVTGISVVSGGPAGTFTLDRHAGYRSNRKTGGYYDLGGKLSGFSAGTYRLNFTVSGDPTDHWIEFTIG